MRWRKGFLRMISHPLSKSKLIAFRQCPKRLWLEIHRPEAREDTAATQAVFRTGHEVGAIAQRLYDPTGEGSVINWQAEGMAVALERTRALLQQRQPIFEAGFAAAGGLAFADVMLPIADGQKPGWKMVEVKASTSVKRYQEDDVAIQSHIAKRAGIDLRSVAIAHIDRTWVYPGNGDYRGLLIEQDMTAAAFARSAEVTAWIADAHRVATLTEPPKIAMGPQCSSPFPCGFQTHCSDGLPNTEYPIAWLPHTQSQALQDFLAESGARDMRDVPDALLSPIQHRVRSACLSGHPYFDAQGAQQDLLRYPLPAYFLDFETIQFGMPRWAGTRPFQMLPFQFSLHRLDAQGAPTHQGFLDLSGNDPSEAFATALVQACAEPLPVFVYHAGFEGARLEELARRFPALASALMAIHGRLVDLLPITRARYYHPIQHGSWSIKHVLPALVPDLRYDALPGVRDGSMAMDAYLEAISPTTTPERKAAIHDELLAYCALDTLAMVEIWRKLSQHAPRHNPITPSLPTNEEFAMSTLPESNPQAPFFEALMQHLMKGTMIPKVQVERSIGPIIGFFLADALSTLWKEDIVMLCPEFPIKKDDNHQSTNIDWLMFSRTQQELLLVELKTTDTSFRVWQADIYDDLQKKITEKASSAFLIDDLEVIGENSSESGKYGNVKKLMAKGLGVTVEQLGDTLAGCKHARVIYLAPEVSRPKNWKPDWLWLSFADLPPALDAHPHADQWPAIRNSLIKLDTLTRSVRNGDDLSTAGEKNYKDFCNFDEAENLCRSEGASVVLGLINWRAELPHMSLDQLRSRNYKYDLTENSNHGKKIAKNWVPGDEFLAHVMVKMNAEDQADDSLPISTESNVTSEYTQIPRTKLLVNHWYVGKGRNADIGLWNGEDFLVLAQVGVKTGVGPRDWDTRWGVKIEPYFEAESGCFQPFKLVNMGIIGIPTGERDYAKTMIFKE